MEASQSHLKTRRADGFALLETVIAITILAIGLMGLALLLAKLSGTTTDSRYMGTEVMLASEKLEDLNRVSKNTLVAGGSLTSNSGAYGGYWDQVQISSTGKSVNIVQDSLTATAPAGTTSDLQVYTRRWVIEQDVPVGPVPGAPAGTGTQRVTVIVLPQTGTAIERAQSFQTSMVRP